MRVERWVDQASTSFVILDVPDEFRPVAARLGFREWEGSLARSFPSDAPHMDRAYENFCQHIDQVLRQAAGQLAVPWESALVEVLRRIDRTSLDWWLTGSAALAIRGVDVEPRDIDLIVDDAGARALGELLLDGLIEPVIQAQDWISRWWGRAFLHARIEWAGGVSERADLPVPGDVGPTAARRLEKVVWRGRQIRVPPLELHLVVSERRGLSDRATRIRRFLETSGQR